MQIDETAEEYLKIAPGEVASFWNRYTESELWSNEENRYATNNGFVDTGAISNLINIPYLLLQWRTTVHKLPRLGLQTATKQSLSQFEVDWLVVQMGAIPIHICFGIFKNLEVRGTIGKYVYLPVHPKNFVEPWYLCNSDKLRDQPDC